MAFAAPLAIAGTMAGGLVSAFGAYSKGSAEAGMYDYRAGVARQNQAISLQNANYQTFAGEERAYQSGEASRFRAGNIVANQGAGNLSVNTGSAPLVQAGQNIVAREDQSRIRQNAGRAAYGEEVKAASYGAEASADTMAAKTSKTAGTIGAFSSLISGATGVATKWSQMNSAFGSEGLLDNSKLAFMGS
jgi:hypothetical protein